MINKILRIILFMIGGAVYAPFFYGGNSLSTKSLSVPKEEVVSLALEKTYFGFLPTELINNLILPYLAGAHNYNDYCPRDKENHYFGNVFLKVCSEISNNTGSPKSFIDAFILLKGDVFKFCDIGYLTLDAPRWIDNSWVTDSIWHDECIAILEKFIAQSLSIHCEDYKRPLIACPLQKTLRRDNPNVIQLLLNNKVRLSDHHVNDYGLLYSALSKGYKDAAQLILEAGHPWKLYKDERHKLLTAAEVFKDKKFTKQIKKIKVKKVHNGPRGGGFRA